MYHGRRFGGVRQLQESDGTARGTWAVPILSCQNVNSVDQLSYSYYSALTCYSNWPVQGFEA